MVRSGGPPPEIAALFDALTQAVNGGSEEAWEAFAQAQFSPALLQKQSRADRAQLYQAIVDRFGTIAIGRVRREGPDAPLQMSVKGSKADGVITLSLERRLAAAHRRPAIESGRAAQCGSRRAACPRRRSIGSMTSAEIDQRLDGYFTKLAADEVFSGVALVARNGVPVFFKAYGLADREKKVANTIRTRFNLGSINKAFTQVAIHQLVAAGKLSYSDTIGKFYPGLSAGGQPFGHGGAAARPSRRPVGLLRPEFNARAEDAVCFKRRLLQVRRQPAAVVRARRARAILQRLLHRPRRHRRDARRGCRMRNTSPSRCSRAPR